MILKKLQGVITPEEEAALEAWAAADPANRALLEHVLDESQVMADTKAFDGLWGQPIGIERYARMEGIVLANTATPFKTRYFRNWLRYAAAIVITTLAGMWFFFGDQLVNRKSTIVNVQDIAPGGNRATLTLADGRTINLSEAQTGIIVDDKDITYNDGGALAGISSDQRVSGKRESAQLVLTTQRGGTYQITLSDGTKVWLNSASTLKYPSQFDGDERVVELMGEAYFDVAKGEEQKDRKTKKQQWPFRVVSAGQTVNVLGTEFNIAAYPDEREVRTTLVEGRVEVAANAEYWAPVTLIPGQQSTTSGRQIVVNTVEVEEYITWKDGFFYFNGDSPQEAFAQLSRWYDIAVVYRGKMPTVQFYGKIERNNSLGSLLKILEKAGLEFEVISKGSGFQLILGRAE